MRQVDLSEAAYRAYESRARQMGLTVEEYLDRSAPTGKEPFVLTPDMRAGIEQGLAEADAGKLIGIGQVRESLARYKAEWRESRR